MIREFSVHAETTLFMAFGELNANIVNR